MWIFFLVAVKLTLACYRTQILSEVAAKATRKLPQNKRVLILGEHSFQLLAASFFLYIYFERYSNSNQLYSCCFCWKEHFYVWDTFNSAERRKLMRLYCCALFCKLHTPYFNVYFNYQIAKRKVEKFASCVCHSHADKRSLLTFVFLCWSFSLLY